MTEAEERVLRLLEFDGKVRCDARPNRGACREAGSVSARCRLCNEVTVLCGKHVWEAEVAITMGRFAVCPSCHRGATSIAVLFEVEEIR